MIEIYHTSTMMVEKPDILHSRSYLDFGPGFYATSILDQAIKYGARFTRRGRTAILNTYVLNNSYQDYKVLKFEKYNESWLDFVTECRAGRIVGDYDIVIGGIANDKVFRTVDLYFSGDINKQECLRRLVFEEPNIQYCFRSQEAIDNCLTFKDSKSL